MIVQRVEKHVIKKGNPYYQMFCDYTHKAKNLYNHANYIVRNEFILNNKWIRYNDLDKMLKTDTKFDDYKQMPTAQSAQQILKLLDNNWRSFFKSIKEWSRDKSKFLGQPKLPKYKPKDGKMMLVLTNQQVKLKDGLLYFPQCFNGFKITPACIKLKNINSLQQVRIIPKGNCFEMEVVYKIKVPDESLPDNGRYLSIDIGLDNLATVVNNFNEPSFIINGKGLKSINKYYNKLLAHYRGIAARMNNKYSTNRINRITQKRNNKIKDYMHKASNYLIQYALLVHANTIVIGYNKKWKYKSVMNSNVNQSFVGISHLTLLKMIEYKAQNVGLNVVPTEESYTSGTSFLDNEDPIKSNYNKKRRIHRGLFISNKGIKINADVNGAYQIMKKVFPDAFSKGIEDVALHPIVVNV